MSNTDVLFLCTDLAVGGAENQLRQMAIRLRSKGWGVAVVSMMEPEAYVDELSNAGIPVTSLNMIRGRPDPRAIWRLRRAIDKFQPGIVHSHMIHANMLARVTRVVSQTRALVCTAHNLVEGNRLVDLAYRLTDRLADRTTHVSRVGLERYLAVGAVSPSRAMWVPNGIDISRFRTSSEDRALMRRAIDIPQDAFLWLTVAQFRPQKAYDRLIRAFAEVPHSRLVIVGEGPLRPRMMDLASRLHLLDRITFLGRRGDVESLMRAADAFVFSSNWEGLPLVLLEAAASGLPIVSTDVGGCREIVADGVSGHLTPQGDKAALATSMRELMAEPPEVLLAMGAEGRRRVEATYDIENVIPQWEELYVNLLR